MIIDCISDLHGFFPKLDGGDLLIIAGDLTAKHTEEEFRYFYSWLNTQNYEDTILIGGNHDSFLVNKPDWWYEAIEDAGECTYLCDSGTEFEGLKIWGSPWSLWFKGINPQCKAFTGSESDLKKKFDLIPSDIDILITHTPPYGILDGIPNFHTGKVDWLGSKSLREHVINRIKPKLHIFGHIHENGGKMVDLVMTKFVNASIVNEKYQDVNKPVRVIL